MVGLLVGALLLLVPGEALAGGTNVAVLAVAGRVWVATGTDIAQVDAFSGRVLRRVRGRYPYVVDMGVSDGNVWATSVENGYTSGALTRIPFERGRVTSPLVFPNRPVYSLAVGSGRTWLLVGPWRSLALASVDQATGKTAIVRLRVRPGWLAADDTGGTPGLFAVLQSGRVARLDRAGHILWAAETEQVTSPPVVGLGSVWAVSATTLYRIDAGSGRVQARLRLPSSSAQLALDDHTLWLLRYPQPGNRGGLPSELDRIDTATTRVTTQRAVPWPTGPISAGDGAVWMVTSGPHVNLVRIDPGTLDQRVFMHDVDIATP